MKRKSISDEQFQKLYDNTLFGGSGIEFFRKEIGTCKLTNNQIDILIKELDKGISSAIENTTASETMKFLVKLKTKKQWL